MVRLIVLIFLSLPLSSDAFIGNIIRSKAKVPPCAGGSVAYSSAGTYSPSVPTGCTKAVIDLRGPGGGGGGYTYYFCDGMICPLWGYGSGGGGVTAGASSDFAPGGSAGGDSIIKRSSTVLAQAAVGNGGASGYGTYAGGSRGTNAYSGLTLTSNGGGTYGSGQAAPVPCGTYMTCYAGANGGYGDKVTGTLTVTSGETLTVIVGSIPTGGCAAGETPCSQGQAGSGSAGYASLTWQQ